ncbi:phBC6A51 family helix-turn-helix protein [Halobacillus sp. A5]|uniref:phBC6A51 family helix-turn-helix protein n=1 Tax=Halobacillus sp. A5 TaxID=2880263 RepID=UPI0020A644FB|nr:phBC6A51 family helix-turn-helix protein [Halobacillus sp. A5]MCP3026901.1 hypothetical protein [Halobacillus sp. A5]
MKRDSRLNEKQIRILLDYFDRSLGGETQADIAKSHGINRKTLSLWANSDHGKQKHNEWKKEATRDAIPQYYDVLKEKALSGSYKHMELFAKVFDLLSAEKKEIVSKEEKLDPVKDGYTSEDIAELDALLYTDEERKQMKEKEEQEIREKAELEELRKIAGEKNPYIKRVK